VTIPAGRDEVNMTVTPRLVPNIQGTRSLCVAVKEGSYTRGARWIDWARVRLGTGSIGDFDGPDPLQGWSGIRSSTAALNARDGGGELKWSTEADIKDVYPTLRKVFAAKQNWTAARKMVIRFSEDVNNAPEDCNELLAMEYWNNGVRVANAVPISRFHLSKESRHRTIALDLGTYARDQVSEFQIYTNGNYFKAGTHIWYIDDITIE
jgi:hypothetical protein